MKLQSVGMFVMSHKHKKSGYWGWCILWGVGFAALTVYCTFNSVKEPFQNFGIVVFNLMIGFICALAPSIVLFLGEEINKKCKKIAAVEDKM